jgi:hypothetical protein
MFMQVATVAVPGRSAHWLKVKNPEAPALTREK